MTSMASTQYMTPEQVNKQAQGKGKERMNNGVRFYWYRKGRSGNYIIDGIHNDKEEDSMDASIRENNGKRMKRRTKVKRCNI